MFGPHTTDDVTTVDPANLWTPAGESSVHADWSDMIPGEEDYTGEGRPTFRYWEAANVGDSDSEGDLWTIVDSGDVGAVRVRGVSDLNPHLVASPELDDWTRDTDDIEDDEDRENEEARRDRVSRRIEKFSDQGAHMYAEGPIMNYWYPVTHDTADEDQAREWAYLLRDLPLCVVEVDGRVGLALTGGGMDLSWEIAEAFARIGYFPPAEVVDDLPKMSGRGRSAKDIAVIRVVHAGLVARAERAQLRAARMAEAWPVENLELNLPSVP